ncbi:MAG: DHH family phosphoesterase [Planctomycetota bacterium]
MSELASDWTTTTTPAQIARWLAGKHSIVAITHAKPDGDAIGSTIGMVRALNIAAGGSEAGFGGVASRAEAWYADPVPPWTGGIARSTKTRTIGKDGKAGSVEPDAIVICDTGSWSQLAPYRPWLEQRLDRTVIIDHHLRGDAEISERRLIEPSAASACEIVAGVAKHILGCSSCAELPTEVAEPLYLGTATDTGWFKHSNVTPATFRLAADLLETGIDHERLFEVVEQRDRPARMKLLARALSSMELHHDDRVAVMTLTKKDFAETGGSPGDSGGFADVVRSVESVRVVALLTEQTDGDTTITKMSLRSKGGPDMVDVNEVAARLGGGGHAQAAGAKVRMPIADAKTRIIEELA